MINLYESDPFDIQKVNVNILENNQEYYKFCSDEFFTVAKNLSVLELGPGKGRHSTEILKQQPKSLTVIEGDLDRAKLLTENKNLSVVNDDIMLSINYVGLFDIVVCLGVLYHLHSPIHLLELVVNFCKPKYLILDCVFENAQLQFLPESLNVPGHCQTRKDWKSSHINLVVPFLTYLQVLDCLGYKLCKVSRISVKNNFSKRNSWMAMWELK